ncbi:MAG TPA: ABC transporter ATP-binding protein [Ignavibacteriaceae bacterium]|nr:ABC transporter ATP-binding protein [Ignavibacteriaceae bacterium]
MNNYSLQANAVKKNFGRRLIFSNISFELINKGIFGISGPNGSGKSTLAKILAGLISPSGGKVIHKSNSKEILPERLHNHIGFVSPYLILYDEFSASENFYFFARIRGITPDKNKIEDLLKRFLLFNRKEDPVKTYSSGMKQRLKFIFALMHSPDLIVLDEPTSNLDEEGKESVYKIIGEEAENKIIVIASNEERDLSLCGNIIMLENFKLTGSR